MPRINARGMSPRPSPRSSPPGADVPAVVVHRQHDDGRSRLAGATAHQQLVRRQQECHLICRNAVTPRCNNKVERRSTKMKCTAVVARSGLAAVTLSKHTNESGHFAAATTYNNNLAAKTLTNATTTSGVSPLRHQVRHRQFSAKESLLKLSKQMCRLIQSKRWASWKARTTACEADRGQRGPRTLAAPT